MPSSRRSNQTTARGKQKAFEALEIYDAGRDWDTFCFFFFFSFFLLMLLCFCPFLIFIFLFISFSLLIFPLCYNFFMLTSLPLFLFIDKSYKKHTNVKYEKYVRNKKLKIHGKTGIWSGCWWSKFCYLNFSVAFDFIFIWYRIPAYFAASCAMRLPPIKVHRIHTIWVTSATTYCCLNTSNIFQTCYRKWSKPPRALN